MTSLLAFVTAFIRGIVEPLVASYQQYRHGRAAQQRDDAQAHARVIDEIMAAHTRDRHARAARESAVTDLLRREHVGEQTAPHLGPATRSER